jgi:capsular polysaccharide transport system ATP-binding protein
MIELRNLTKAFHLDGQHKVVADNICAVFQTGTAVALLGRNGTGKSTLLRMIAGTIQPTSGEILSTGTISWPIGFAGSFHPDLTGAQNTRFVARVYGVDTEALLAFVEDFAELGGHFHLPFSTYSAGMRARLAFGVSMGIPFDTYLVDEVTAVGDAAFRRKSADLFRARLATAGAILVTHEMGIVRELCEIGAVMENGKLELFDNIEAAIRRHHTIMTA